MTPEEQEILGVACLLRQRSVRELKVLVRYYGIYYCVNWRKNELVEELVYAVTRWGDVNRLQDRGR